MKKQIQKNREKEYFKNLSKIEKAISEVKKESLNILSSKKTYTPINSENPISLTSNDLNIIFQKFLDYPVKSINEQFFRHVDYIYRRDFFSDENNPGIKGFKNLDSYTEYIGNIIGYFSVISLKYINEVFG